MKKYILSLVLICTFIISNAQGKFQFVKETHDFGKIEEGTIAKYDFVFKNIGNRPIIIESASASCGCTTPFYTKTPVAPGKTGKISVSFNSAGRSGTFNKSITIRSNASTNRVNAIYIKGFINPRYNPSKPNSNNTPTLALKRTIKSVGTLKRGQTAVTTFLVKNTGTGTLLLTGVSSQCKCIVGSIPKSNLNPSESTTIQLKYTPNKIGVVKDVVYIYSNDGRNGVTKVYVTGTVEEGSIMKTKKGSF